MRWSEIDQQDCSVAQALSIVGDRWTMLILRDAFMRVRRFEDFLESTGAPRPVLSERLKTLVDNGVLEKRQYSDRPDRFEYRLTEMGRDLWPVVISLLRWGDKWLTAEDGAPVEVRHKACGHAIHPELACPDCGEWLTATDMEARYRQEPIPTGSA
jgi:DNA-binding HxlR family transcriptional regulator